MFEHKNQQTTNVRLSVGDIVLKQVHSCKFLGVHIDDKLTRGRSTHCEHLLKKLNSGLYNLAMSKNVPLEYQVV